MAPPPRSSSIGFSKTIIAIEHLQSGPASQFSYMLVDQTIAESLIDCAVSDEAGETREYLREQFPGAEMAQNEHDWPPRAQMSMDDVDVFDRNAFLHFLRLHQAEFDAAQKVRAQPLKMAADQPAQFAARLFITESDRCVAKSERAIFRQDQPRAKAKGLAEPKKHL